MNFVFGAHLGFDAAQRERHACIFVNLEQLGEGGAKVSPDYLQLLETSAVVDYDRRQRRRLFERARRGAGGAAAARALPRPPEPIALEERPIDLLFIGSMNERRRAWIERIEACGVAVSLFDGRCMAPNATASSCRPRPC